MATRTVLAVLNQILCQLLEKKRVGSFFFEQLVTLVMFFSGFFDVENHVSIMRKSEISVIFRAGPICQPVTGAASIEKKIF